MQRVLLSLALLTLSTVASADQPHGSWKDAHVASITAYTDGGLAGKGYVVVTFSSNGTDTPSCASGYPRNLVIDMSAAAGAYAASITQAAFLTGQSLTVTGTGTCSVSPTAETMASVQETGSR